jgi:hypothetical protein
LFNNQKSGFTDTHLMSTHSSYTLQPENDVSSLLRR